MRGTSWGSAVWQKVRLLLVFLLLALLSLIAEVVSWVPAFLLQYGERIWAETEYAADTPLVSSLLFLVSVLFQFLIQTLPLPFAILCLTLFYLGRVRVLSPEHEFAFLQTHQLLASPLLLPIRERLPDRKWSG